ncbi:hypothetical protein [Bacillus sp. 03113]|uniref:hypothetical protein n=1 Tax=Bacillus sp. 03113 TaxID=2578211 RepID=UPI0011416272|nr:hypothetical protein [Bacillus sp. 03113]
MLVEINLLPKRETKNMTLLMLSVVLVCMLVIEIGIIYFLGNAHKQTIAALDEQIFTIQQQAAADQQKLKDVQSKDSVLKLQEAVKWAEKYPIKTIPIIEKLTVLLPERGYFLALNYNESGKLTLKVQFDSSREAAYYLEDLSIANWVYTVTMTSLSTNQMSILGKEALTKTKEESIVPRYTADYEITLNRSFVKADEQSKGNGTDHESSKQEGEDS